MKRSFLILTMSLLILLTACRSEPPALAESFEAEISAVGGALDCTAHVIRTPDAVTVEITSPASVAGIRYTFEQSELHTDRGDLSCITDADSLPDSALPALLYTALSRLTDAVYVSSDDSGDHYSLSLDTGAVHLTCRSGIPVSLTADGSPCTVTFSV